MSDDMKPYKVVSYVCKVTEVNARSVAEAKGKGLRAALRDAKTTRGFVTEVENLSSNRGK